MFIPQNIPLNIYFNTFRSGLIFFLRVRSNFSFALASFCTFSLARRRVESKLDSTWRSKRVGKRRVENYRLSALNATVCVLSYGEKSCFDVPPRSGRSVCVYVHVCECIAHCCAVRCRREYRDTSEWVFMCVFRSQCGVLSAYVFFLLTIFSVMVWHLRMNVWRKSMFVNMYTQQCLQHVTYASYDASDVFGIRWFVFCQCKIEYE